MLFPGIVESEGHSKSAIFGRDEVSYENQGFTESLGRSKFSKIFTHQHPTEGNVGIGKIPDDLHPILDEISVEYKKLIPDKDATTYHTYYADLAETVRSQFDNIQYNVFWDTICHNPIGCIRQYIPEMNELYYSNPKPTFENRHLYGASANLIPHRDCILYRFHGICLYRIIIGLTNDNHDTFTQFIHLNVSHNINRGDYMIFDFDKTLHQVVKIGQQETPRILMKLHCIVCENCAYSAEYVGFISYFYKYYYYIARYTEQLGTDPHTFAGFFFGLLWELPFHPAFFPVVYALFATNVMVLHTVYRIPYRNVGKLCVYSVSNMIALFLAIVMSHYLSYLIHQSIYYGFASGFPRKYQ